MCLPPQKNNRTLARVHATGTIWSTGVNTNLKVLEINLNIPKG